MTSLIALTRPTCLPLASRFLSWQLAAHFPQVHQLSNSGFLHLLCSASDRAHLALGLTVPEQISTDHMRAPLEEPTR